MAYSKGKMSLINDEGKIFEYEVENINGAMTLKGPDGFFYLREDSKPDIIRKLREEIDELFRVIEKKQEICRRFKETKE